jgi:hypothetical protein
MNKPMSRRVFVPLRRVANRIAGHIRKPYTLRQIIRMIESDEYNAELLLQHLLRWVADNVGGKELKQEKGETR